MSSSSKFGLTDNEAVYELASQLHSGILDIFGYGIYTSVYFVALYLTLSRETERPRTGSAILITVMWILVTIHTSINWTYLNDIYIRHGESREAQLTSLFLSGFEHFLPQYIVDVAVIFISLLLADMTMIWRCWVLHGRSWHIIVIPGLSLAAGSVCGYGMYTGVYLIALYLTLSRSRIRSALLVSIMWILVTIHASIRWAQLDDIYIRNGETREAQLASLSLSRLDGFFSQSVTNATVTLVSLLLADLTMIWRCWVLHGRRWLVVVIPGLSLVSGAACYIWRTVIIFFTDSFWTTDQIANLELLFLSTTVLTNIYCTTSIIYRVIGVDGWRKSLKTYRRLTEILIESSVLYTVIYVMRIGLQIYTQYFTEKADERARFAQALAYSITGIAPTLVIARLAAGYGRPDDSWTRASLPHMPTTMRSLTESLQFRRSNASMDTADLERSTSNSTLEDESARLLVV